MKRGFGVGRVVLMLLTALFSTATLAVCVVAGLYLYFGSHLPSASNIRQALLDEPLRVHTADHRLIGEFGIERRQPLAYDQIPKRQVNAFVAAEDNRFWEHPGVDYQGMLRAAIHLITTGRKTQGGSTITMQLARNLYLSDARTYTRKIKITVKINPQTGQRALNGDGIPEIFRRGHAPTVEQARHSGKHDSSNEVQQLF